MTFWLSWRFWGSLTLSVCGLAAVGLCIAGIIVQPPPTYFRASHFEFTLPDGWVAEREGNEVICQPQSTGPVDAMIIMAKKERSLDDHLEDYKAHLNQPKKNTTPDGRTFQSEVIFVRETTIGGYQWVDSLHYESEVPGYYTRYLVAITSHLGFAVTFTVSKDSFEMRNEELERSIESLDIYQAPSPYN